MPQFARLALSYLGWLGLALYLIFGAPGCAGSRQDRWTPEGELAVPAAQAMADWCQATDGRYCPQLVARTGLPLRAAVGNELHLPDGDMQCGMAAFYDGAHGHDPVSIVISLQAIDSQLCRYDHSVAMTREQQLVAIISHELGHAGGLEDVVDQTRIMHESADSDGLISDVDVAEMAAENEW